MKNLIFAEFLLAGVSAFAAIPEVTSVSYSQGSRRVVKIAYTLDADAIITADVLIDGVSVGVAALTNLTGDVNCLVKAGDGEIQWDIRAALPGHADITTDSVRVALTAWPKTNPPDYLVADLSAENTDVPRYYTSLEALPGGLMSNPVYRESKIVLKRVHAAGQSFVCGATGGRDRPDKGYPAFSASVRLPADYYLGVFEVTQQQMTEAGCVKTSGWNFKTGDHPGWKPCAGTAYYRVRENPDNVADSDHVYPKNPHDQSYLGLLRARSRVAFDLPSESQYEFAARAGYPTGYWGDGKLYDFQADEDPNFSGCYAGSGGRETYADECGFHGFNSFGFADMGGNVREITLDGYLADPTTDSTFVDGEPHVDPSLTSCVAKAGSWNNWAYGCYPWSRVSVEKDSGSTYDGFRVAAPLDAECSEEDDR